MSAMNLRLRFGEMLLNLTATQVELELGSAAERCLDRHSPFLK